jgi:hypothetical protein
VAILPGTEQDLFDVSFLLGSQVLLETVKDLFSTNSELFSTNGERPLTDFAVFRSIVLKGS